MWIVPVLFTVGIVAAMWAAVRAAKREKVRQEAYIDVLARRLDGIATADRSSCMGDFEGAPILHVMASRSCGSSTETWTEVTTKLERRLTMALRIRPKRTPGMVATTTAGDESFDAKYVVEGAPVPQARAVLTRELLAFMCTHTACELDCDGERVKLSAPGWVDHPADAELAWRALATVRAGLAGQPRSSNDEREVAALGVMRANAVPSNGPAVAVILAVFAAIMALSALSAWLSGPQ